MKKIIIAALATAAFAACGGKAKPAADPAPAPAATGGATYGGTTYGAATPAPAVEGAANPCAAPK
jgi:hypothetical protein